MVDSHRVPGERSWRLPCGPAALLPILLACARIEPPPGGPPDTAPPHLVATVPESLSRLPGFKGQVEFRFDEVVSEGGGAGAGGELSKLIILSPSTRDPEIHWRRNRITVRPEEGWKPNRAYRVQLLPGVTDLRRNRSTQGATVTFTTGAPFPEASLAGLVVDWSTSRPAPQALVQALLLPDSLPYRMVTDSSGRFSLGPLPAGEYLVSGVLDENHDLRPDPREAFDTVRVAKGASDAGELWAFVHDTAPARIKSVTVADSLSATVEFTQMLAPRQRLDVKSVSLRLLPDSTPVTVTSLLPKSVDDSLHGARAQARDSAAAADSAARAEENEVRPETPRLQGGRPRAELAPLTTRPPLFDRLVLRAAQPWKPDGRYALEIRGVRNVSGVAGDVTGVLTVPKAPASPDTSKARGKP
jgi:hypothetical protein